MRDPLTIRCPAKLNLTLSVGPPLADDAGDRAGLHPLCSWMVALDFHDTLQVHKAEPDAVASDSFKPLTITFDPQVPVPQKVDWPLESDLAYRAWRSVEQHVGRPLPIEAALTKRIPAGAGLGGGSADAAGMLIALNRLYELQFSDHALNRLAQNLGSDVPFALGAIQGQGSAVVEGLGEKIEPVTLKNPIFAALILPPFRCNTGAVYQAFDGIADAQHRLDTAKAQQLAHAAEHNHGQWFNDLAEPACHVQPALQGLLDQLDASGMQGKAHVTGSGSAVFVPCPTLESAREAAQHITAIVGHPTLAVQSQG